MYEAFYGMARRPFALVPDPAFLFMSRKHRFAFSTIDYALSGQAGFTVITGDIGSGKTTLIRHLVKRADRDINYGVISNTHEAFGSLLHWVLAAFDVTAPSENQAIMYRTFVDYLITQFEEGRQTIVIVDEAQNLSIALLEELRLLSNINSGEDHLLQMILVGQPQLLEKLRRPELTQFAQRISVSYHLLPLSYTETRGYVRHRLQVAQAAPDLFTERAVRAVFHFTNGVPRLINSICDMACVYGYADSTPVIDIDSILAVIRDKERSGLLPLHNTARRLSLVELEKAIDASVRASCAEEEPYEPTPGLPAGESSRTPDVDWDPISDNMWFEASLKDGLAWSPPAARKAHTNGTGGTHNGDSWQPPQRLSPVNAIVPIMSSPDRPVPSGGLRRLFGFKRERL
jgi:type II secretory pathway predicted ATPase ExeA